ncbi:hypothetical protein BpHYR1_007954 [Brachionus plicatilis]|uniref:Uncharacterized protein n=1 Tax=Brachionus plicatilis TaxID=10195 RepID=A0A3M7QBH2_BRAPC|nr:hypothetical protein BpHYR1_007954 [Brachionus plicatilis]
MKQTVISVKFFFGPFCGRPICTRSAVQRPFSWPATKRSVFILDYSRPAISRSVCLVAGPGKVGLFKNGPQTAGKFTDGLKCCRQIRGQNRPFILAGQLAVQVRP